MGRKPKDINDFSLSNQEFGLLYYIVKALHVKNNNKHSDDWLVYKELTNIDAEDFKSQTTNLNTYINILVKKGYLFKIKQPKKDKRGRPIKFYTYWLNPDKDGELKIIKEFDKRGLLADLMVYDYFKDGYIKTLKYMLLGFNPGLRPYFSKITTPPRLLRFYLTNNLKNILSNLNKPNSFLDIFLAYTITDYYECTNAELKKKLGDTITLLKTHGNSEPSNKSLVEELVKVVSDKPEQDLESDLCWAIMSSIDTDKNGGKK
jgi:hypothetical protein